MKDSESLAKLLLPNQLPSFPSTPTSLYSQGIPKKKKGFYGFQELWLTFSRAGVTNPFLVASAQSFSRLRRFQGEESRLLQKNCWNSLRQEMIFTSFSLCDKLVILKIAAVLLAKVSSCTSVKLRVKSQPSFALKLL